MNRYLARLIFNIAINSDTSRFDEQFRIISAANMEEAIQRALQAGHAEEESFAGAAGTIIRWQFAGILELFALDTAAHGELLFSRSILEEAPPGFMAYVQQKTDDLLLKSSTFVKNQEQLVSSGK